MSCQPTNQSALASEPNQCPLPLPPGTRYVVGDLDRSMDATRQLIQKTFGKLPRAMETPAEAALRCARGAGAGVGGAGASMCVVGVGQARARGCMCVCGGGGGGGT